MQNLETVAVVLGTYNGEKYLDVQLDSILKQKDVKVELFIRDDGSVDNTMEILSKYESEYENVHIYNGGKAENRGIKWGYLDNLRWALNYSEEIKYFAFADQDDYWLPEKLISAVKKLPLNMDNGSIYYSNKTIVDDDLNFIRNEDFTFYNNFSDFFFVSKAYGCTMVIDRILADLSVRFISKESLYHDDWIHRLSICLNAKQVFDENSYILYRQHGDNEMGSKATEERSLLYLINGTFKYFCSGGNHNRSKLAKDIYDNYSDKISENEKVNINMLLNYKNDIRTKWKMFFFNDVNKRKFKDRLIWKSKVLLNFY